MKSKKLFYFLFYFLIFAFLPLTSWAFEIGNYPSVFGIGVGAGTPPEFAKYFLNLGIAFTAILAAIIIAIGGLLYLISLTGAKIAIGNKEWIKSGITGLLIVLAAYTIAYTINPDLVVFKVKTLFPIKISLDLSTPNNEKNVEKGDYEEIPLGVLTENLVSKNIDCYDFDENGNPIEGESFKALNPETKKYIEISGPTFLNHDRADCILKIGKAIEKKSELAEKVSEEIVKLMNQCSCGGASILPESSGDKSTVYTPGGVACKNDTCSKKKDTNGEASDCKYSSPSKCPIDKKYVGSTSPCKDTCSNKSCSGTGDCCPSGVKQKIEYGPIEIDGCTKNNKKYAGLNEFRSQYPNDYQKIKENVEVQPQPLVGDRKITIIKIKYWDGLRIVDQITYLNGKMEELKQKIKNDLDNLEKGRKTLEECSKNDMEKSSVFMLQLLEKTKEEKKTINISHNFSDPETQTVINSSKYCSAFSYGNSSCYQECQNMCPDYSKEAVLCYKKCGTCESGDLDCFENQEKCVENCFNNKPCEFGSSKTFGECINSCRDRCSDVCEKSNSCLTSDSLKDCKKECENNSKCVLNNQEKCLFNSQFFQQCGELYNKLDCTNSGITGDCGNLKSCLENSYLCKYGSEQNAGFPDCLKNPYSSNYSSSYLYEADVLNKMGVELCPNPYQQIYNENLSKCVSIYPNTLKCPASSQCPICPCDVSETNESTKYRITEAQCSKTTYSTDPLTFYCRTVWEPQAPVSGRWLQCNPENEIPVGKTVDDARAWANSIFDEIDNIIKNSKELLSYLEKIGKDPENNHCQCNSKCEKGEPICQAKCIFQQTKATTETVTYPDGTTTTVETPAKCTCVRSACSGNPCQKLINWMQGKTAVQECSIGVENLGIAFYVKQIKDSAENLTIAISIEGRSDILKELTYSRKKMNECSQQSTGLGEDVIEPISCTKAYEHTTCLGKRCYGILDGKTKNIDQTDNWYCSKALLK